MGIALNIFIPILIVMVFYTTHLLGLNNYPNGKTQEKWTKRFLHFFMFLLISFSIYYGLGLPEYSRFKKSNLEEFNKVTINTKQVKEKIKRQQLLEFMKSEDFILPNKPLMKNVDTIRFETKSEKKFTFLLSKEKECVLIFQLDNKNKKINFFKSPFSYQYYETIKN